MRILLVEDNADHRELMRLALTGHDATWQVEGVVSGEEALRHLTEGEAYDLVFLDYSLPTRDGLEVLAEIRRSEAPLPVVMVTGRGDEQVAVEAMRGGAYDYIVKGEGYLQRLSVVAQRAVEAHQLAVERRRAEEALEQNRAELRAIYEHAPVMMCVVDADRRVLYANRVFTEFTGIPESDLQAGHACGVFGCVNALTDPRGCGFGQNCEDCSLRLAIEDTFKTGYGCRDIERRLTLERDGVRRDVVLLGATALIQAAGKSNLLLCLQDITERKRAEEALVRRTRQLDAIRAVTTEISRELDLTTLLELINRRAAELVGATSGTVRLWDEQAKLLIPVAWHGLGEWVKDQCRQLGEGVTGVVAQRREGMIVNDYRTSPYALPAPLEHTKITAMLAEPLLYRDHLLGALTVDKHGPGGSFTEGEQGILRLFTTQAAIAIENARLYKRVRTGRERLQRLSHRLVEVQESERRSIARELHDEIGQLLTGVKLLLEMSARVRPEKLTPPLSEAQALVNELVVRVREMSLDLRPSMLDDLGLLPALLWHFERYTTQTNVRVNLQHSGLERRVSPEIETAAYRIVQEALNNVARHARTPEVTVRIHVGSKVFDLQVEDKGVGFDAGAVLAADASIGLAGMRERAHLLGGHLSVESAPGAGTTVKAELPLGDKGAVERRAEGRRQ